jgi:nicotinamide-nucleotide amidase
VSRPRVAILLTGSELLDGRTVDLNGRLFGESLTSRGARVTHLLAAPDDAAVLEDDLHFLLATGPALLVVSGGLGTTHDDLTTAAVARATGRALCEDAEARGYVVEASQRIAARRGLALDDILDHTLRQALLPESARALKPAGVAPGFVLEHEGTRVVVLPGVPGEVRVMWPAVMGELDSVGFFPAIVTRSLRVYGVGELQVAAVLDREPRDGLEVAVTAGRGEVAVQVRHDAADAAACRCSERLLAALGRETPVFSDDGRTIDELVADLLRSSRGTVAVAESCTGGGLGARLTERPGSSAYFLGGVIAYASEVKIDLLNVPAGMLAQYGAVSEEVAAAMAEGVRAVTGAVYGLGVSGVAGPDGGSEEKPVGLVYLALAGEEGTTVERHLFPGDRQTVRAWSATAALHLLRTRLQA